MNSVEMRDPLSNNTLCLKAVFSLSFKVYYNSSLGYVKRADVFLPHLNESSFQSPNCSLANSLTIHLKWAWYSNDDEASFVFTAVNDTYILSGVEAKFYKSPEIFPDILVSNKTGMELDFSNNSLNHIIGRKGYSYKCRSVEDITVNRNKLVIEVSQLQFQAFLFESNSFSHKARSCPADDAGSRLIPITVGCVLAGFIVMLVVSYIVVTRPEKKPRGYEAL